jgi:hypothetical protein
MIPTSVYFSLRCFEIHASLRKYREGDKKKRRHHNEAQVKAGTDPIGFRQPLIQAGGVFFGSGTSYSRANLVEDVCTHSGHEEAVAQFLGLAV